jgi:hypothetical protein
MSILTYFDKKEKVVDKGWSTLSEKYAPETLQEFMGNYKAIQAIHTWFGSQKPALMVVGPCGCGKTVLVDLFVKHYRRTVFTNYSNNKRSKKELTLWYDKIKHHTESILIVDEMETLVTKHENMSVAEIVKWIGPSTIRIVFVVNAIILNKMVALKDHPMCTTVYLEYPDSKALFRKCMHVLESENVSLDDDRLVALKDYIARMKCEPRSVLNDLLVFDITCANKERDHDIYQAYQKILRPEVDLVTKMRLFGVDSGTIPVLFQENYMDFDLTVEERCNISRSMAEADVFHKRMFMHASNSYVDMYAVMSSIFTELVHNRSNHPEKSRPKFSLIWTKQSAMCQKRKYLQSISQHLRSPFYNVIDFAYMHAYLKYLVDEYRANPDNNLAPIQQFVDAYGIQDIDILFYIYISFNVNEGTSAKKTDTKPIIKKVFTQLFSPCFQDTNK